MYKVMLADDEGIVIDSLTYIIRQNFDGECQVESAKTGRSVIELAESFRPDIAFMDIQMPGINGIEAMKEIKKNNPNLIFIVMSAYDKFDYAQEAINLGVLEYLHKPVNQKKIVEVLKKAMDIVDNRREKRSRDLETKEKLEIVVPMLEQGFIMAGLLQAQDRPGLENYKSLLGIRKSHMFTLVLEFGDEKNEQGVTNPVGAGVRLQGSYQQVRSIIKEYYACYVGPLMNNRLVCCVPTDMKQGDYESRARDVERCRRMMDQISDACGLTCRVGVGSILPVDKLEKSYEDASKALGNSDASVAHCRDLPIFCEYEEDYPLNLEEQLFDCVRAGKGKDRESVRCQSLCRKFYHRGAFGVHPLWASSGAENLSHRKHPVKESGDGAALYLSGPSLSGGVGCGDCTGFGGAALYPHTFPRAEASCKYPDDHLCPLGSLSAERNGRKPYSPCQRA